MPLYHQYSSERLEKKAVEILSTYREGELLRTPQPMNIDDFAENHLGMSFDYAYLSDDGNTLGCTCFNDGQLMVWDKNKRMSFPIEVEKGEILLDNDLMSSSNEGRIRFTIAHECAHWILHRRFFAQRPGVIYPTIPCIVYHMERWDSRPPMTDQEIREWQANRLGAAILMPAPSVRMVLANTWGIAWKQIQPTDIDEGIVVEMAAFYEVSHEAMRYRFRDLGLTDAL